MVPRSTDGSGDPISVTADLIHSPRRGEIFVGGLRMCLIDIETGFRTIRESMEELVGPVSKTILYNAGSGCGRAFAEKALQEGLCRRGESAFKFSVESYAVAGFGGFEVRQVDARSARAVVVCVDPPAFEAYPSLRSRKASPQPVCDYSRGVLAGFLAASLGRNDLLACEVSCRAKMDPECVFIIGQEREIMQHELSAVSESIATQGACTK